MRRLWCLKYLLTLLASTAITFHLLYSKTSADSDSGPEPSAKSQGPASKSFTLRKLAQGGTGQLLLQASWTVLPGNVTVHQGRVSVPLAFAFDINAERLCDTLDASRKSLLVFVASRADHFGQRLAIRETWGLRMLQDALNYRTVFLIGQMDSAQDEPAVLEESQRYGDLVRVNLSESFRSLGGKSLAGLEWSRAHCPGADFVAKTDDDILLHVPNLWRAVQDHQGDQDSLLLCRENRMRRILRKELAVGLPAGYHKYEVTEAELPGEYYPPYCSGMAYLFSRAVRDKLLEACATTPVFFIEDVYLTGFCRHKAGVTITPHAGVTLRPPVQRRQAACVFRDGRVTSQEVGTAELRELWAELNTQGFFCPEPVGLRRRGGRTP